MKRFVVLVAALFISAVSMADDLCDFYQPTCQQKKERLDTRLSEINASVTGHKISATAGIREASAAIASAYPNDPLMTALSSQLTRIADQKLPDSHKESLADGAFLIVATAYQDRKELIQLSQSQIKKPKGSSMDAYVNTANAMAAERAQYEVDNDPMEPMRRAVAVSALLSGIGKAFATSWGQSITPPSTICNTYGGTMYCYPPY